MSKFTEMQDRAALVRAEYSDRNTMYDEQEKMILLEASGLPTGDHVKKTISPVARNTAIGAARLLASTDPKWRVPYDSNLESARRASSKLEKFSAKTFASACRVMRRPIHYDASLGGLVYAQVDIAVKMTSDMAKAAKGTRKAKMDVIAKDTPLLFEVLSSYDCYPTYDPVYGLVFHYRRSEVMASEIVSAYGEDKIGNRKLTEKVYLCDVWDEETHAVYIEGENDPIMIFDHGLDEIPIASMIVEGSPLFNKTGQQSRQPFLYALQKSGMWQRLNLGLTAAWTNVYTVAANPHYVYYAQDKTSAKMDIDYSVVGGVTVAGLQEKIVPLETNAVDPSLLKMIDMAQADIEASTMFTQALGQPLGANAVYSTTALLAQAGRLPLTMYQRMISTALGQAMSIGLKMLRKQGGSYKVEGDDFNPAKDIPESFNLECKLDIDLPQDKRMNAEIAKAVTEGDMPLASVRWAREELMGIDQSDMMEEEIMSERQARQIAIMELQKDVQRLHGQDQQQPGMTEMANVPPSGAQTEMAPPQDMTGSMGQVGEGVTAMPMTEPLPVGQGAPV